MMVVCNTLNLLLLTSSITVHAKIPSTSDRNERIQTTSAHIIEPSQRKQSFLKQEEEEEETAAVDINRYESGMPQIMNYVSPGFIKGQLISLADGSVKPMKLINYDKFLVWNFDTGVIDEALPLMRRGFL